MNRPPPGQGAARIDAGKVHDRSTAPRVGFELTGLELDSAGSARATRNLRAALAARDDLQLVDLAQPPPRPGLAGRLVRGLGRELAWFPVRLPRRARRLELDVLHCPGPLAPVRPSVPLVLTLHDAMAWERPEWFGRALVLQHRLVVEPAARRAAVVLTPSQYSAGRLAERLDLDPERIEVTPFAPDPMFTPRQADATVLARLGVRRPYVLTVGTLQPRKNLGTALAAHERLCAAGGDHQLVVVGARGWGEEALAARLASSAAGQRVVAPGRVEDRDLVELYRGADCLLFCSRGEGFGMPVLEAMACGTAVVCSDSSSLPEVAGGAARLADADDVGQIAAALQEVLGSPARRAELEQRGRRRAADFSWERCAGQTVAAYRSAAGW